MALHTVELIGDNGTGPQGPGLAASNAARLTRLRAQAEELQATTEPNLFHRWAFNAIHDLDQAAHIRDADEALSAFLDLIEEELIAAQRAHDRHAARAA